MLSFCFDSSDDFTAFTTDHGGPAFKKSWQERQTKEGNNQIEKAISKGTEKSMPSRIGKVRFENLAYSNRWKKIKFLFGQNKVRHVRMSDTTEYSYGHNPF